MYNPQELQNKARTLVKGVDTNAQTTIQTNVENNPPQEENWAVRGLATAGNFVTNIIEGAVKSIEGIVDAGAMLVGLFGADVDDFVSYDFTGDVFGTDAEGEGLLEWSWGRNLADVSYLDNENIVNQIAEGVGGLLPTVAIGILTGGTSLAGTAASAGAKAATIGAKIAQTGTFVASAMGNASESALQDGANYNQALGYGALSGVTEGVIESISGGIGGTKMGTALGKQIAKKTGTKLATTFIGEGLEEVASDLINPLYQRITGVNEEAKVDTNNLFRTFVVGGSIGAIMGGVGRKLTAHQNADKGGEKFLKVAEEVSEIEDAITEKENALTSENKTQEDIDGVGVKVVDKIINSVKTISDHLQSMTESQRSNALNIINGEESIVSNLFEVNGEIKSGVLEDLELSKKRHFSANSILKSQQINEELSNINQEKGWNLEIDDSQINENERVKLAQFYAVKNGLSEKTGKNLNFVMVKGLGAEAIDGFYSPNGKTIYITKDTLNNSLYKTTAHEVEHFVDNDLLQKYLINSARNDGNNGKLFTEIVKKVVEDKNYGVTKEDIDSAIYKKSIGQKLSQQEELAYSELTAHLAENLLGNVDFIKRLARSNRGLFNKIKNFISDKVKTNSKSERYRMAEYLFDNALKEIKEKDVVKSEQFDKTNEIRYTIKNNSATITKQDYETLESDIMTWYMNQKGKILTHVKNGYDYYFIVNEDADSNGYMFTILSKSKAVNIHERETYYDEVKQHGERFDSFVSDFRSEQENSKFHLLSADGRRAERTNRETNNRETEPERIDRRHDSRNGFESGRNNQVSKKVVHYDFENRTITYKDGTKAKFSLKDSDGNELSPEQQEYFKNSKVVDKDGNLLVVYHGSPSKFTEFSHSFMNTNGNAHGKGFYFTEDVEYADGFKKAGGQLLKGYLNIQKPISETDVTISKANLVKLIKATCEAQAKEFIDEESYDNIEDALLDTWVSNYVDTYSAYSMDYVYRSVADSVLNNCENDADILAELVNGGAGTSRVLTLARKTIGYDGIIFDNGNGTHQFISFESNQFKNADNIKPTKKQDIRFSLKDSQDRTLTEAQIEYFKDSKVRDEQGNLRVMYHGTTKNFNTFLRSKMGKNGLNLGEGFYFTPNKDFAERYSKGKSPRIMEVYLNVKNPLSYENSLSKNEEAMAWIYKTIGEHHSSEYIEAMTESMLGSVELIKEYTENTGEGVDEIFKRLGYDGIDAVNTVVVFDSNQVKYTTNANPTKNHDIRFSLKDDATYTLSDGQVNKKLADYTKLKVYSKVEAERIINSVVETNLMLDNYDVRIIGKTKTEIVETLWNAFNTKDAGNRTGVALKIADYIIDNAIMENIYLDNEKQADRDTIDVLRPYLHNINLSGIKDEIKARYGNNSAYLLWSNKDGYSADQIAQELIENGYPIKAENEADIFFEIDDAYRKAVKSLNEETKEVFANALDTEQRKELRQNIAKDILRAFDSEGKESKLSKIIEEQREKANVWKNLYFDERSRNKAINSLLYEVDQLKGLKEFKNASQYQSELFKGSLEKLGKIKWRGNFNESGTRKIVGNISAWYNKGNQIVGAQYKEEIADTLNAIALGNGKLTAEEIRGLANVVAYFRHFIETNNKIYRAGKYVEAKPLAERYVQKLREAQNFKVGWTTRLFDKVFNGKKHSYMQAFGDPMSVARYMDKYDDGFFTEMMQSFRDSAVDCAVLEMELMSSVESFFNKHKKYQKTLQEKQIKYNGKEIPLGDAIYVYMALNREQALLGLAKSGFKYKTIDGKEERIDGFAIDENLTLDEIKAIAIDVQEGIRKQLTDVDFEFIEIAERLFNEDCKKLKSERDKQRLGYSNITDGYYIPIRRAYVSSDIDIDSTQFEINRVSSLSFNKETIKGASNELFVESIDLVLTRHLSGIAKYYSLSNMIDTYNIIYNVDIGGNLNKPISIKTESVNVWKDGEAYFKDLLNDIQGIKKGDGSGLFGFIRSGFAKFQLGANPKVWFTQLSSLFASGSILDYGSVVKGFGIKTDDVDEYCSLAKVRNNDNVVAVAQGNISSSRIGKVSDVLMKPIGKVDRFVIKRLFGACQVQVQKDYGLKFGTKENKVKAGELLEQVILETQQNALSTERSKAMRSSSELMKTLTMFTSDAMKVMARVVDAYGELSVLKARRRQATDPDVIKELDKKIKNVRKKAFKSTTALVSSAMFMALITQGFKWLYNKDDEDEDVVENVVVDAFGNMLGGLPIFKDIYAKVMEGYDFDGYQYSAINDLLNSFSNVVDLAGDMTSGNADSRDVARNIKNMSYAVGQIFGIPLRNVYNVFYGLTKRISPSTAYNIDNVFYKQSYRSDLKKAIEKGDEEMISTIAGLMMDESIGAFDNSSTRQEMTRLMGLNFNVLPNSIPNSITFNDEEVVLSNNQKESYKKVYAQSISAIDKLISTNGYKIASDDLKVKAIKYVYKYYYYEAQQKALNLDLDNKLFLFGQVIPIEKMALILAEAPTIAENSKNRKKDIQRYLQGKNLTAIQKYMLMGYFGYKNTKGESAVKSVINQTSLTKKQKELLISKCGY